MSNKRSRPRLKLSMPIQAIGRSVDGEKFREICQAQDASNFGLCFTMQSIVERGTILYLTMRMPRQLRLYDIAKDLYQIYAQVQHSKKLPEGGCEVGVCFLGKNPPPGYENYQTAEFTSLTLKQATGAGPSSKRTEAGGAKTPEAKRPAATPARAMPANTSTSPKPSPQTGEGGAKRPTRRDSRYQIPIDVMIEFLDLNGKTVHKEPGLITNISKHGACVMSTHSTQVGGKLKITMMHEDFSAQACIKAVNTGQGGVWNLHVEFLDRRWTGGT